MVGLYYVNTLGWSMYDYYHYGRPLTLIHSAEVFMITTTMVGFNDNTLGWTIYDYYHYGRFLTSIHSTEVCMTTTTMVGL